MRRSEAECRAVHVLVDGQGVCRVRDQHQRRDHRGWAPTTKARIVDAMSPRQQSRVGIPREQSRPSVED
jgi:hypothetical protein